MRLMPGAGALGTVARRWLRWSRLEDRWAWVAVVAEVIVVAVTLAVVRNAPAGRPATPPPAASVKGVPEYYVALPLMSTLDSDVAADAIVGDTFTGKKVATVHPPHGWWFARVTAAGDDRTFVVEAIHLVGSIPTRWYLLRLTPGAAHPATLRQLPISAPPGAAGGTIALSPDGTMLAFATGTNVPALNGSTRAPQPEVQVYSTVTGALLHTWPVTYRQSPAPDQVSLVSWTGEGNQLAFQAQYDAGPVPSVMRLLSVRNPGHDLIADSRPVSPSTVRPRCVSGEVALVTGNGKTMMCDSAAQIHEPASHAGDKACRSYNLAILQFSTATGKFAGTLYQTSAPCLRQGSAGAKAFWTNDAGTAVLASFGYLGIPPGGTAVSVVRFGLVTAGKFTSLPMPLVVPAPLLVGLPSHIAW